MRWLRDLLQGPLVPDLKDAAAAGIALGYVGGFLSGVLASALDSVYEAEEPIDPGRWAAHGAGYIAILAVTAALAGRVFI